MASIGFGSFVMNNIITSTVKGIISFLNMPVLAGVRIECYKYKEKWTSKISTQMIIDFNTGRQVITDNIAPMPRTWDIGCYIGSATVAFGLSQQAYLPNQGANVTANQIVNQTKSVFNSAIAGLSSLITYPIPGIEPSLYFMPSLNQQVGILYNAWKNNKLIWFQDKYKKMIPVAIEECEIDSVPEVQNKVPLHIVLREVVTYNNSVQPIANLGTATIPLDATNPASTGASVGGVNATSYPSSATAGAV